MKPHRPRLTAFWGWWDAHEICDLCGRRIVWVEQRQHTAAHLRHAPRTKGRFALASEGENSYDSGVGRSDANSSDNMRSGHRRASTSSVAISCLGGRRS
jgi:hypothetical protein